MICFSGLSLSVTHRSNMMISITSISRNHTESRSVVTAHLSTVSCGGFIVTYAYTPDGLDAGYAVACANGTAITRTLARDPFRREWVTGITNAVNGVAVKAYALTRDPGGRVTARNGEAYAYNARNELASAVYPNAAYAYAYDEIGDQKSAKPKPEARGDRDFKATPQEWSEERYPATQRQHSVVMYISESGAVSAEYEYDPFGKVIAHTAEAVFRVRYSCCDPD